MSAAEEPFPGSPDDMMNTVAALRAQNAELVAALEPFVRALDALEAIGGNYPDDMSILRASLDYYTRHVGRDNDEIVERDSVRLSDLRRIAALAAAGQKQGSGK